MLINLLMIALIGITTWLLSTEGLWGASIILLESVFAVLIALNWFEPLAGFCADKLTFMADYADAVAITALFCGSLMGLRMISDIYIPNMVRFSRPVHVLGGLVAAALTGVLLAGVSLIVMETLPLQKDFLGYDPNKPVLSSALAPNRKVLSLMKHTTAAIFDRDPPQEFDKNNQFISKYTKDRRVGTLASGSAPAASDAPANGEDEAEAEEEEEEE